jgi:hypothetical protein
LNLISVDILYNSLYLPVAALQIAVFLRTVTLFLARDWNSAIGRSSPVSVQNTLHTFHSCPCASWVQWLKVLGAGTELTEDLICSWNVTRSYRIVLLQSVLITITLKDLFVSCGIMNLHIMNIPLYDDKNNFQSKVRLEHNVGHDKLNMLQSIRLDPHFLFLKLITIMFKSDIFNVHKWEIYRLSYFSNSTCGREWQVRMSGSEATKVVWLHRSPFVMPIWGKT